MRWLLRSLERFGWLDALRRVVILHSDHHPPPSFLVDAHPQLRLYQHAAFAPASALPLRSLEEITAHLHNVPELTPWIIFAENDGLVCGGIDELRTFAWRGDRLATYTSDVVVHDGLAHASTSWERGAAAAGRALREAFGPRDRYLDLHMPHLLHVPTLAALAARWPGAPGLAHNAVMRHDACLVDTGNAVRFGGCGPLRGRRWNMDEIHTNSRHLAPPATLRSAFRLCMHLARARHRALFINVQGPGISAEYDDTGALAYGFAVDAWLAASFPRPSRFERAP